LDALSKACEEASKGPEKAKEAVAVETLETKERKRPLILGEEMDAAVQQCVESLRLMGTPVNATVVMGAAEGIVAARASLDNMMGNFMVIILISPKAWLDQYGICKEKMFHSWQMHNFRIR